MWNVTAKQLQEKYFERIPKRLGSVFWFVLETRNARNNSKRRLLQTVLQKKGKVSVSVYTKEKYHTMIGIWNENTPEGLQINFFLIATAEEETNVRFVLCNFSIKKLAMLGWQLVDWNIMQFV